MPRSYFKFQQNTLKSPVHTIFFPATLHPQKLLLATLGSANGAGATGAAGAAGAGCGAGCAKRVAAVGVLGATAPSDAEGGRDAVMLAGTAGGGFVAVGVFGPDAPPELLRRIGAGGAQGVGRGGCGAWLPQGVTREYMLQMLT